MRGGERRAGLGGAGSGGRPMHGAAPHAAGPRRARPSPYLPEALRLALRRRVLLRLSADPSVLPLGGAPAAHRRPRPPGPLHRGQELPGAERHRRSLGSAGLRPPPPASPRRRSAAAGAGPSPDRAAAAGESARPRPAPPRTAPRPPAAPTGGAARGGEPRRGGEREKGEGAGTTGGSPGPAGVACPAPSAEGIAPPAPHRSSAGGPAARTGAGHTGHSPPRGRREPPLSPRALPGRPEAAPAPNPPGPCQQTTPSRRELPHGAGGSGQPRSQGRGGGGRDPKGADRCRGSGVGSWSRGGKHLPPLFSKEMLYPSVAARFIYLFIKPLFRNNSKLSLQKARLACSSLGNLPPNEGSRSPARYLPHALLERGA